MRTLASGLVLGLLVAMLSGCVGSGGSLSVSAPVWEAGYTFSYREQGSYSGAVVAQGHGETEKDEWGPRTKVFEVLNTTLEAHGEPVYLAAYAIEDGSDEDETRMEAQGENMQFGGIRMADVSFVGIRQRDLLEIPAWLDMDADCTQNGCTQSVDGLKFAEAHQWSFIQFPLEKGKKWSTDMDIQNGGDDFFGDIKIRYDAKVVGLKTVETPLGSIQAVRVDWTMKPIDLEAYKAQVREEADDADQNLEEFDIELDRAGSFYYSEEYATVVKSSNRGEYFVEIRGKQGGQEFDFSARGQEVYESVLEGARLVPKAERGLDYVLRLATGKASLGNATGVKPEQVSYGLKIVADKNVVNAADSEAIAFKASIVGAPALPEGHKVKWRLIDVSSKNVAAGEGLSFNHPFASPGEYTATAEAFDAAGTLTTSHAVTVYANYLKTTPAQCPVVAAQLGNALDQACDRVDVPVLPGVQYLRVTAQVESPLGNVPALNVAQLFVGDHVGNSESDATREGGEYAVEIWMFWQYLIDGEPWKASLRHQRGVLEEVTYTVDVRYDAAPAMTMPTIPMGTTGLAAALDGWVRNA
ncbi:MAG TPA: hypothetical protein VGB18_03405 [Candidatus Thermoplasmatota archaeon]